MFNAKTLIYRAALALAAVVSLALPSAQAADKGEIVVFMASTTNCYFGQYEAGLKDEAAKLGYSIKGSKTISIRLRRTAKFSNSSLPATSLSATSGCRPTMRPALALFRALAQTGTPVVQANQLPIKGTESLWVAYAGVSDFLNGKTAGELLLKACAD